MRKLGISVICFTTLTAWAAIACGQHTADLMQLPVLVDGSKTPEAIPDRLAYKHFLLAVAEPEHPSPDESARQAARLAPLALSPSDYSDFVHQLGVFKSQLDDIEARRLRIESDVSLESSSRESALLKLKAEQDSALTSILTALHDVMTADGASRLDRYIREQVKRRIVIYGTK